MFSVLAQKCHILIIFVTFKRIGQNSAFLKESIQGIFIKIVVAPLFGKLCDFCVFGNSVSSSKANFHLLKLRLKVAKTSKLREICVASL